MFGGVSVIPFKNEPKPKPFGDLWVLGIVRILS